MLYSVEVLNLFRFKKQQFGNQVEPKPEIILFHPGDAAGVPVKSYCLNRLRTRFSNNMTSHKVEIRTWKLGDDNACWLEDCTIW